MVEAVLYLGDCLEILSELTADAVVTDPPYGIGLATNRKSRGRSRRAKSQDFAPIIGDNEPFDPTPLLGFSVVVLFGANWYADLLPPSGGWIVWDKLDGLQSKRELGFCDNSDCELIWTNVGNVVRIMRHRWMGMLKASEQRQRRVHPTQKPIALMERIIKHYTEPGTIILDPYMGSGTTGVACMNLDRNFIGIEIVPEYYDMAYKRIVEVCDGR